MTIYQLTGRVTDSAGNFTTKLIDINVDESGGGIVSQWGPKILQWVQPMAPSLGPKFYASPSGSDLNGGTFESPWRSLAKANLLSPGDSLVLRGGNYGAKGTTFTWSKAGTEQNPITIIGYPGERPIIEGKITIAGPWQRWSKSYFRGPTGSVGGPGPNGEAILVNLDGTHLELSQCEVAYDQWHAGIGANATVDYRILSCYVHDNGGLNGDYNDAQNNTSHGMYVSPSSYGLMANCLVEHNDAKGIMGRHDSHHLLLVHNTIIANGRPGSESWEQTHDWVWANGIFMNNGNVKGGVGISMGGIGPFMNRRNVFWHNGTSGTSNWSGTGTTSEPLVADPKFVRPAVYSPQQDPAPNWDHHLQAGSPAIGYGDPDYGMPDDIMGIPRNGRFDCGAYQFVS